MACKIPSTIRGLSPECVRRLPLVLLLALGLAMGTGCSGGSSDEDADTSASTAEGEDEAKDDEEKEEDAIAVEVGPVRQEAISAFYSSSATLRAERSATVKARTAGVIKALRGEEGDRVKAGQVLAVLEDDEQRIAASKARTVLETKKREHERAQRLLSQGLLSDESHGTTEREMREASHSADLAELELSRTTVRAPFAGTLLERHLDVGATVTNGTEVYDLADLDPLYADVTVPERHVARLAVGQSVRLTADASGDIVNARIERIAPDVDPKTGTVKVTTAAEPSPSLRSGSFVRVDIVTDTHEDALVVPRKALVSAGRKWSVFRLKADDREQVERVWVKPGYEEGDLVEILRVEDSELEEGVGHLEVDDEVVVLGAPALTHEARVAVQGDEESDPESVAEAGEDESAEPANGRS